MLYTVQLYVFEVVSGCDSNERQFGVPFYTRIECIFLGNITSMALLIQVKLNISQVTTPLLTKQISWCVAAVSILQSGLNDSDLKGFQDLRSD